LNIHAPAVEARRLAALPLAQARSQFGDRVARAVLNVASDDQFARSVARWNLAYNAELATELRKQHPRFWT
jgi:hypothetical protein